MLDFYLSSVIKVLQSSKNREPLGTLRALSGVFSQILPGVLTVDKDDAPIITSVMFIR